MKPIAVLASAAVLLAGLAACSSSASSARPATAPQTGTETAYGTISGPAALASNPVFQLTLSGLVDTSGTIPLGRSAGKGASRIFDTAHGKLAVVLTSSGTTTAGLKSMSTCRFAFSRKVPFTVDGAKSTGRFASAAGKGSALVVIAGNLPKTADGRCDVSRDARPSPKTTAGTFTATMTLRLKH